MRLSFYVLILSAVGIFKMEDCLVIFLVQVSRIILLSKRFMNR